MTAASPAHSAGQELSVSLLVDGTAYDLDCLGSVDIWHAANRIPRARIVLYEGDADSAKAPFSDADRLIPGARVQLAAGYDAETTPLFTGIIIGCSLAIDSDRPAQLVLDCADVLLKMTLSRRSAISEETSDAELITALVSAAGGLVGRNAASTVAHPSLVQAHASDWDMMVIRAQANGGVVIVDGGKVDIALPGDAPPPALKLEYGVSILSLDLSIAAAEQLAGSSISARAWSYAEQTVTAGNPLPASATVPGNLSSGTLAGVCAVDDAAQRTGASMSDALLADWATGTLIRHQLAQVRGSVRFQGSALAKPGTLVTLANVGDRFSGDAWVGAVSHRIAQGDWRTTIEIGLPSPELAAGAAGVADVAAAGQLPPLRGLQTGVVTKFAGDPTGEFRVQVRLPLFDADSAIWARLASFYGSNGCGALFVPEVGDEVVLGFMNEDPTNPVILGSVHSSANVPAYSPDDRNTTKAIVTRSKLELSFNDDDKALRISTPGGRVFTLDDHAGTISIVDAEGSSITMTRGSVGVFSSGDLTISSGGNMTIACGADLSISAAAKGAMTAMNLSMDAGMELKLATSANASLKAGAVLTINGALVKIN